MVRNSKINKKLVGIVILVLSIFLIKGSNITSKLDINNSNKTNLKESNSNNKLQFINLEAISLEFKDIADREEISKISGTFDLKNIEQAKIKKCSLNFDVFSTNSDGSFENTDSWTIDSINYSTANFDVDLSNETRLAYSTSGNVYYSLNMEILLNNGQTIISNSFYLTPTERDKEHSEKGWNIDQPIIIENISENYVTEDKWQTKKYYDVNGTSEPGVTAIELLVYKNGNLYKKVESYPAADWSTNVGEDSTTDYLLDKTYNGLYTIVAKATINNTQYYSTYKTLEDITPGKILGVEDNYSLKVGETQKLTPQVTGDDSNTSFKYSVTNGTDIVSVDDNGLITAKKSGVATIQITKGEYGYNNEAAFTKNIYITVTSDRKVELTEDGISETVNNIRHSDFKLFIKDYDNATIDTSKINFYDSEGNYVYEVTYVKVDKDTNCSTSPMFDGCNASLKVAYDTNNDIKITKIEFAEGFVTYKDGTTNETISDSSINITLTKGPLIKGIEDKATYNKAVTPTANYTQEPEISVTLKKNDGSGDYKEVENYTLGQEISESGDYSLEIHNSIINKTVSYDFTIDIAEIVMQDIKVETNELTGSFDIKLTLNNIDNLKNFNVNNIKFYDSENNIVKLNSSIIGKTVDHDEDYNYLITYKELDTNNKNVDIAKIVLKEGTISYYNKDKKEYSENKEYSHNVSIKIKQLIDNLTETNPVPFKPNISVINEDNQDDYLVLLYKNYKLIKNYQYGDAIEEEGTYTLKIIYNDSIYKITFNVVNTKYIELNEETDDIKIDEENKIISLYTPNDISSFKNRFKTLKAKIYNSNSKLENSKITGTELTDEKNITTGSKVVLNKNTILEDDIYTVVVKGDINKDGLVDMADIYLMGRLIAEYDMDLNDYQIMAASISKNNKTNMADLTLLCQYVAEMRDTFKGVIK